MSLPFGLRPTLEIVQLGDPVLRAQAADWPGGAVDASIAELIEAMRDTMHAAPGVGLAAPQIGVSLRLAVIEDLWPVDPENAAVREREPLEFLAVLNPRYAPIGTRTAMHYEGCLSMEGYTAAVERPADILASWISPDGQAHERELHGWQARIFQHETDHLDGTLYIDKALTRSLCTSENYGRMWADPAPDAARVHLGF